VKGGKTGKGEEESFHRERVVGEKDGCAANTSPSSAALTLVTLVVVKGQNASNLCCAI
jgi:hypothetical protein